MKRSKFVEITSFTVFLFSFILLQEYVFPALCNLVCDSPNFKVRINAAWALSVCNSYGKYIISVWKSTILALENSQHVPNYVEYAHRDTLVQQVMCTYAYNSISVYVKTFVYKKNIYFQLCLTVCHLAVQLDVTELMNLWAEVRDHIEDVKFYMQQFQVMFRDKNQNIYCVLLLHISSVHSSLLW